MSQGNDKKTGAENAAHDAEGQRPLAGQRLAEARRARDVSIAEIAKELHLDEPKVQALEENQFQMLGAPVFAKGHLRKYAELVGVPIEDILTDYYQLNRAAGAPPVVGPKRRLPSRDINLGPWIAILVAVAIVAGGLFWFLTRESEPELTRTPGVLEPYADEGTVDASPEESAEEEIADEALETLAEPEDTSVTDTSVTDSSATDTPASETPAEPPPQPSPQDTPVAADDEIMLVLSFTGECWTEVTDANGDRLYFGLGQAGQTITRAGVPPLQALFGDRNNVSVTVNGDDFPISSGGRRGNTARVTIDQ